MNEIWKDIPGYEGLYQVSNLGRVKSLGRYVKKRSKLAFQDERMLCSPKDKYGYLIVTLCREGKPKKKKVHRLVAQAFIPNPENKETVNHINGDKNNNTAMNLEWNTSTENLKHAYAVGLNGRNHFINNKNSKAVAQFDKNLNFIKIHPSMQEAGRNGFSVNEICKCCKGKIKTHKGYIWKYAKDIKHEAAE